MKRRRDVVPSPLGYTAAAVEHFAASGLGVSEMRKLGVTEYGPLQNPELPWLEHSTLGIPYTDPDGNLIGFTRYRVLAEHSDSDKAVPKYRQAKGTGVRLFMASVLPGGWRRVLSDPSIPILITEGEKKAAAGCLLGVAVLAVAGVDCWGSGGKPIPDWDLYVWPRRRVVIVFDSDAAHNRHTQQSAERLAAVLRQRGADVYITVMPSDSEQKVGLDDFIQQDPKTAKERLEKLIREAKRHVLPELEMNDEFAMVPHGSKALVLQEDRLPDGSLKVRFYRPQDLTPLFDNRFVEVPAGERVDAEGKKQLVFKSAQIFKAWMKSPLRREFKRTVFAPEGCAPEEYKLWQGFSVEPREGDCTRFLEFLRRVICSGNEDHYVYLLKWLATMFQRPGDVPRTAVVLRGRQGTGKSTLADTIGSLLAAHYVPVVATEQLVGKFNGHTEGAVFLFADEAVFPGDKRSEGVLKTLITQKERNIERKGIDIVKVRNCAHVMFATNHDWAVAADQDDRRLFVLDVSDAHADDREYFAELHASMDKAGKAALLHYLLNYPADDFFALKPPKTRGLLEQKLRSLGPREKFWLDCLVRGDILNDGDWPSCVPTAAVQAEWERVRAMLGDRHSAGTELGIALAQFVPGLINKRVSVSGRQRPHYILPSLAFCRAAFARRFGERVTWTDFAQILGLTEDLGEDGVEMSSRPSRPKFEIRKGKVVAEGTGIAKGRTTQARPLGRLPAPAPRTSKMEKF
jgi:hypothetical protein